MPQNNFSQNSTDWFWISPNLQEKLDDPNSDIGNCNGMKQGPCYVNIRFKPKDGVSFCKYDPNDYSKCFLNVSVERFLNWLKSNHSIYLKLVAYSVAPDELNLIVEIWNLNNPPLDTDGVIDKVKEEFGTIDIMDLCDIECISSKLCLQNILEYMRSARNRYEHPVDGKKIYEPYECKE